MPEPAAATLCEILLHLLTATRKPPPPQPCQQFASDKPCHVTLPIVSHHVLQRAIKGRTPPPDEPGPAIDMMSSPGRDPNRQTLLARREGPYMNFDFLPGYKSRSIRTNI